MSEKDDATRRWSIGELARASGLTVRALRHYDAIGLVTAAERTASGHRRYTGRDLRRLYRVRGLRALGLSLEEIAGVLADSADDLAAMRGLLTAQLGELEVRADRTRRLTEQIRGLLSRLDASMPDPEQFLTSLEMMSMLESSFTPEQLDRLARRRTELGPAAIEAARTEWTGLVEELLTHVRDDTPPGDPRVQALVARWDTLGDLFHDDEGTKAAARTMWRENGDALGRSLPWPADRLRALVRYLERARQAAAPQ